MKVYIVPTELIDEVWGKCVPLLEKAFELANGRYSPESVRDRLETGEFQLFIAQNDDDTIGCCTTRITEYPNARWLSVVHCGGSRLEGWLRDGFGAVETWARMNNCAGIEVTGRREWARVLKMKSTATKMEFAL